MLKKHIAVVLTGLILAGFSTMVQPPPALGMVRFVALGDTRGDVNGVNTLILGELVQAAIA